jgi:hypothetical protein
MTTKAKNRPERKPLHIRRVLDAKTRPGFVRRWVNEEIGAVEAYEDAGYTCVLEEGADTSDKGAQDSSNKGGSVTRRVINKDPNASTKTAVLMEIPEEFYREDQAAKQREIDELEMSFNPKEIMKRNPDLYGEQTKKYS